jgi:hypothetical protein
VSPVKYKLAIYMPEDDILHFLQISIKIPATFSSFLVPEIPPSHLHSIPKLTEELTN